jgi:hypothetical protein
MIRFINTFFYKHPKSQSIDCRGLAPLSLSISFSFYDWLLSQSQSQSYVTSDGQSSSLSWRQAPIWGPITDVGYCQTVECLLMQGALSDERSGMSFTMFYNLWLGYLYSP